MKKRDEIIDEYLPYYRAAGFGDYALDFGGVDAEVIKEMGEACKKYCEERMKTFEVKLVVSYKDGGNSGGLKGGIEGAINHGLLEPMDGGEVTGWHLTVKERQGD